MSLTAFLSVLQIAASAMVPAQMGFGPAEPAPSGICAPLQPEVARAPEPVGETFILPGTGFAFVIPDAEVAEPAQPLPPCEPEPVRPRNLDIFGFYALPVGDGPMAARWGGGHLLDLADGDPGVASFVWSAARPGANPLAIVNERVNTEIRYVDDSGGDRWAPAAETLAKRSGDCEDLAIAKLALLAKAGVEMDRLFLLVVRDTGRQTDHAVAAVRWENRLWVLDNRIDQLQAAERVMDYVPLQSFSGQWAWTYGYKGGTGAASMARAGLPKPGN